MDTPDPTTQASLTRAADDEIRMRSEPPDILPVRRHDPADIARFVRAAMAASMLELERAMAAYGAQAHALAAAAQRFHDALHRASRPHHGRPRSAYRHRRHGRP